ncbi:MAG TPA: hypothetical protein PKC43_11520 [Phycisphaerales bacterium]|nr:hypothetical protein [Phycisphaerales bacterium]HMP38061.1 hypothetical protein [Phycisphaerales bacterium]
MQPTARTSPRTGDRARPVRLDPPPRRLRLLAAGLAIATVGASSASAEILGLAASKRLETHAGTTWSILDLSARWSEPGQLFLLQVVQSTWTLNFIPNHNPSSFCLWAPPSIAPAYDSFFTIGGDGSLADSSAGDPACSDLNVPYPLNGVGIFDTNPAGGQGLTFVDDNGDHRVFIGRIVTEAICDGVKGVSLDLALTFKPEGAAVATQSLVSGAFTMKPSFIGPCNLAPFSDLNGDNWVDGADLGRLLANWGPCSSPDGECPGDINDDGTVDGSDLGILLASWGYIGPPV